MEALRVLVVDDERPARAKIIRLLATDPRFRLVGEASHGFEALEQIDALAPDLVFLDIQMPGLNGFEVLEALGEAPGFVVVFSTAFDEHALRAFEAHAVDYLLKPYAAERFARALDKARAQLLGARADHRALLERGLPRLREKLVLRLLDGAWNSLPMSEITMVIAAKKHTRIVSGAREYLVRKSFTEVIARLDERFVRTHRSEVIHLDMVVRVDPWTHGDFILVLKDGSTRILTRTRRKLFMQRFGMVTSPR